MIPEWKNTRRQTHMRSRLSESGSAEALCRSRISVNEILDPAPEQVYIKQPTRLWLLFVLQHSIEPNPPRLSYDPISSPSYDQQNTPIFSTTFIHPYPFTMMMKFTPATLFVLFVTLLSTLVSALPILESRDVFVPPVITPATGTIWTVGSKQNVTWCVSQNTLLTTNLLIVCCLL